MRIVKPASLGFLPKPYRFRREHQLAVGALGFFGLGPPAGRFLPEQFQWGPVMRALPPKEPLDFAMPKAHGEMLLAASAYAPDGRSVTRMTVRAALGTIDKSLLVIGDREWRRGIVQNYSLTDPKPFTEMPITYARAFGGPRFPPNRAGVGYLGRRARNLFGVQHGTAWNIESPADPVRSASQPHQPAGWGPLDICSPARQAKAGTYDDAWLKHDFPGLASDVDWSLFNAAPEDQQIKGYFGGGEPYRLEGMHPGKPVIEGKLPSLRARCFIHRRGTPADAAEECPMVCDTVWFFPAQEIGVLIYRAQAPLKDSDALDVESVMLAYEAGMDPPRAVEHYREALRLRIDPAVAVLHALNDSPLTPAVPESERTARAVKRAEVIAADRAKRQTLLDESTADFWQKSGLTPPADYSPPRVEPPLLPPMTTDEIANGDVDLAQTLEQARSFAEGVRKRADAQLADLSSRLSSMPATPATPQSDPKQLEEAIGRASVVANDLYPDLPAAVPVEFQKVNLDALVPAQRAKVESSIAQLPALQRKARRAASKPLYPKEPLIPSAASGLGKAIQGWRTRGDRLAGRDFAGADLVGASFAGDDLREVMFERADLSNADFRGARLQGAVFTGARLDRADFTGADLTGASLSGASAKNAVLRHARLDSAILSDSNTANADFTGTTMTGIMAVSAVLDGASLVGCDLSQAMLTQASAVGTNFSKARFQRSVLLGAALGRADFSGASLEKTVLLNANAQESIWRGSQLISVQAGGTATFSRADMTDVVARQCGWRGSDFRGANLTRARMVVCDFGNCCLDEADLTDALLWRSLFMQASLQGCRLERADFFQALCRKADLRGSRIGAARVVQADFTEALFEAEPLTGEGA